jgi:hypothetical protein
VALLAQLVVVVHIVFTAFAVAGGLLVLRWRWMAWLHLPAVLWAAYVELSGAICPLTPLENSLRAGAGLESYEGDFVARYLLPILYPEGLTRAVQWLLGLAVLAVNAAVYGRIWRVRSAGFGKPGRSDTAS